MCNTVLPFVSGLLGHAPLASKYRTISSKPRLAAKDSGYSPKYVLLKKKRDQHNIQPCPCLENMHT